VLTGFWWGYLRERDYSEDLGVDGRIILIGFFQNWDGDMYWIDLAQDMDRWRAR
jgi:hypothetical protein